MSATIEAPTIQPAEAERTVKDLFEYSSWVHVGDGAEACEHRHDDKCAEEGHFHAWVRLANPYQVRDINEKAKAAQARRLRALRDPESDAAVILENELEEMREAANSGALDMLVNEIVEQDHAEDLIRATRSVRDLDDPSWEPDEEGDGEQVAPKLYANIEQDFEEYQRQLRMDEDQRGEDFPELVRTVEAYTAAMNDELKSLKDERRGELSSRPLDDLMEIIRKDRRDSDAAEAYLNTYHSWTMFTCTFKPCLKGTPNERVFTDFMKMKHETPDVVLRALRTAFESLEGRLARSRQSGNS